MDFGNQSAGVSQSDELVRAEVRSFPHSLELQFLSSGSTSIAPLVEDNYSKPACVVFCCQCVVVH